MAPPDDEAGRLDARTVLAVFAHPDDESLACGGTLARLAELGARSIVLCASRGERGSISDPSLVPDGDLGRVRAQELREAARVLGVSDVVILDHPDGSLRWAHVPELQADIVAAVERYHPDAVITFAEDGLYWHADHIGVHERTCAALRSLGAEAPPLYFVTLPEGAMRNVVESVHPKDGRPSPSSLWNIAPGVFGHAARAPTFVVDVRHWAARKLSALRCHRTQMGSDNPIAWLSDDEARSWLGVELFRRERLESSGDSVLEQLASQVAGT